MDFYCFEFKRKELKFLTLSPHPLEIPITATQTLQDNFDKHPSMSEDIFDHLCAPEDRGAVVSSSVYIPSLNKLVCGYENGKIVVTVGLKAARARLLENIPLLKGKF